MTDSSALAYSPLNPPPLPEFPATCAALLPPSRGPLSAASFVLPALLLTGGDRLIDQIHVQGSGLSSVTLSFQRPGQVPQRSVMTAVTLPAGDMQLFRFAHPVAHLDGETLQITLTSASGTNLAVGVLHAGDEVGTLSGSAFGTLSVAETGSVPVLRLVLSQAAPAAPIGQLPLTRLERGGALPEQVLTLDTASGVPVWKSPLSSGLGLPPTVNNTLLSAGPLGQLAWQSFSDAARLTVPTSSATLMQVLTLDPTNNLVKWRLMPTGSAGSSLPQGGLAGDVLLKDSSNAPAWAKVEAGAFGLLPNPLSALVVTTEGGTWQPFLDYVITLRYNLPAAPIRFTTLRFTVKLGPTPFGILVVQNAGGILKFYDLTTYAPNQEVEFVVPVNAVSGPYNVDDDWYEFSHQQVVSGSLSDPATLHYTALYALPSGLNPQDNAAPERVSVRTFHVEDNNPQQHYAVDVPSALSAGFALDMTSDLREADGSIKYANSTVPLDFTLDMEPATPPMAMLKAGNISSAGVPDGRVLTSLQGVTQWSELPAAASGDRVGTGLPGQVLAVSAGGQREWEGLFVSEPAAPRTRYLHVQHDEPTPMGTM